jgi:hypothetical protein
VNNDHTKDINAHAFAFSYTQPHSMKTISTQVLNSNLAAGGAGDKINSYLQNGKVNHSPFTIDHSPHKKTAVMRKFLRNAFPIAFVFVIANLFLANSSLGQIALRGTATTGPQLLRR